MKKLLAICVVVGLMLVLSGTTQARQVTLIFDPNDILDLYPAGAGDEDVTGENKSTQVNARRIHEQWASTYYETFHNPAAPHTQPNDYNTYVNWRNSLDDAGEGLAMFNSWFLNNPAAASWGETVVTKPGTGASATSADGWSYRLIDDPYSLGGTSVQWWTTDSSKRLRPTDLGGANIGEFSITLDLYYDTGPAGWDENDVGVSLGDDIRFWVGCLNGDDAMFYRDDTQAIYFDDQGWGNLSPAYAAFDANYSIGACDYGSGFEGALSAEAVPEPGTMMLIGSLATGLFGIAGIRRKRR